MRVPKIVGRREPRYEGGLSAAYIALRRTWPSVPSKAAAGRRGRSRQQSTRRLDAAFAEMDAEERA